MITALDSGAGVLEISPPAKFGTLFMETTANLKTMAEYYIHGITQGFVTAAEVIAWADEIIVAEEKTEDWMLDISTSDAEDRMGVLHHLHAVKGEVQPEILAQLLKGK